MEETAAPQDTPEALPEGRLEGRRAFADLVRAALAAAAREGWPHIVLSDPDFEDWPLGERAVIESLNAWAGRGRRIQLLAQGYERLRLQHVEAGGHRQRAEAHPVGASGQPDGECLAAGLRRLGGGRGHWGSPRAATRPTSRANSCGPAMCSPLAQEVGSAFSR